MRPSHGNSRFFASQGREGAWLPGRGAGAIDCKTLHPLSSIDRSLPTQILLNNFLYDISELTLPTDLVDPELTRRPAHWDLSMIRRFMLIFGPGSLYDFLTFALMLGPFAAGEVRFHSGWFVESLCTQTLVIFISTSAMKPSRMNTTAQGYMKTISMSKATKTSAIG